MADVIVEVPAWMELTEISVSLHSGHPNLLGFANVTLNDVLAIRGIRIVRGRTGKVFLAMPSRRSTSGLLIDIVYPIRRCMREWLESQVLARYQQMTTDTRRGIQHGSWRSGG